MYSRRLEQVTMQLVDIRQRPHAMRAHIPLVPEGLELAPDLGVAVQLDRGLRHVIRLHAVVPGRGRDRPLLGLDLARAVVDLVRHVGALRADVAHLADEADAGGVGTVDLELGLRVGLRCLEGLLDCDGAEGGSAAVALFLRSMLAPVEIYCIYPCLEDLGEIGIK